MVNTDRLKGRIREQRKTQSDCAEYLGIQPPTFNQKLNNIRSFGLSETGKLADYLDIPDIEFTQFFFSQINSVAQNKH